MPRLGGVERLWYSVPWWLHFCKRAPRWWYNRKCDSLLLFWANWLFNSLSVGVLRFKIRIHLGPFVKPFYHFHTDLPSKLTRRKPEDWTNHHDQWYDHWSPSSSQCPPVTFLYFHVMFSKTGSSGGLVGFTMVINLLLNGMILQVPFFKVATFWFSKTFLLDEFIDQICQAKIPLGCDAKCSCKIPNTVCYEQLGSRC